jgi:osmotically-inducible protein OsmY
MTTEILWRQFDINAWDVRGTMTSLRQSRRGPKQGTAMNTRLTKFALAAALLTSLAAVVPAQAQTRMDPSSADTALAAEVKAALLKAAPFRDADVDLAVTASNGKVQLSGWVTYADNPELARKIASSVSGVKQVTENLHTWSSEDDARI